MELIEANQVYGAIQATRHTSLADDLVRAAVRYARIRVDWMLSTSEDRQLLEEARSRAHTAFIESCNILSRNMAASGEDNSWRERIGQERKTMGDFACLLHCLIGILAR